MVDIEPNIFIKNINYREFLNDFKNNYYNSKTIPIGLKFKFKNTALVDNTYGLTLDDIKCYININNQRTQVITDNIINYDCFIRNDGSKVMKGGVCHWCRKKYEDYSLGVPIKILTKDNKIFYLVEGNYCCFECVYAGILAEKHFRPLWKDSEILLKIIYDSLYTNTKLEASRDWKLLDINGGSLTEEQFFNNDKHLFKTTCNFIYPIKNIYM